MAQVVSGGRLAWLYQARRVCTQTAGGGGALTVRLSLASGQVAKVLSARFEGTASAGATLVSNLLDEDGAVHENLLVIGAGAGRIAHLPQPGGGATTTALPGSSENLMMGPGTFLSVTSSVALQNETLTVAVQLLLFNVSTEPTWDTTGSAGTPSLAASTISAANTLQLVLV